VFYFFVRTCFYSNFLVSAITNPNEWMLRLKHACIREVLIFAAKAAKHISEAPPTFILQLLFAY